MRITIDSNTTAIDGTALLAPVAKSFASGGGGGTPTDIATIISALGDIVNKIDSLDSDNQASFAMLHADILSVGEQIVSAINAHP